MIFRLKLFCERNNMWFCVCPILWLCDHVTVWLCNCVIKRLCDRVNVSLRNNVTENVSVRDSTFVWLCDYSIMSVASTGPNYACGHISLIRKVKNDGHMCTTLITSSRIKNLLTQTKYKRSTSSPVRWHMPVKTFIARVHISVRARADTSSPSHTIIYLYA